MHGELLLHRRQIGMDGVILREALRVLKGPHGLDEDERLSVIYLCSSTVSKKISIDV